MDIIELAKRLWNAQAYALHRLCESVGEGPFRDMAEALASAVRKGGRILVTGQGESGIAARKFVQNLCAVDVPAVFFHPGDSVRISGGLIQPGDVMVLISKGGATESVLRWMNVAQKRGIPSMCVTQNSASPLALGCDDPECRLLLSQVLKQDAVVPPGQLQPREAERAFDRFKALVPPQGAVTGDTRLRRRAKRLQGRQI